ncbi:hypothetical protein [Streptomyces sp. NPDC058291]|uniref:hypothetical protein n=1 Tax=Streptomyces sp. NPDC058291 TaxID=3346427 RepID=UPI0036E30728
MQPSRARLGIMATLLGLVAVLGVVWLVRSATTDSRSTPRSDATSGSADAQSNASGHADGDGDVTADGGRSRPGEASNGADGHTPGGGEKRKDGRPSVPNGVNINGSGQGGCAIVLNMEETPATVTSVSFKVTEAPGKQKPKLRSDNGARCHRVLYHEANPCDGLRLKALEGGCVAGVAALSNAEAGHYVVRGTLKATFLCDNVEKDPCKRVKDWRGPKPTQRHPVLITGESTSLDTSIDVPGSKSSSPDDSPSSRSPSPPDGVSPPPDVSPESQPPDDGSSAAEEG